MQFTTSSIIQCNVLYIKSYDKKQRKFASKPEPVVYLYTTGQGEKPSVNLNIMVLEQFLISLIALITGSTLNMH